VRFNASRHNDGGVKKKDRSIGSQTFVDLKNLVRRRAEIAEPLNVDGRIIEADACVAGGEGWP